MFRLDWQDAAGVHKATGMTFGAREAFDVVVVARPGIRWAALTEDRPKASEGYRVVVSTGDGPARFRTPGPDWRDPLVHTHADGRTHAHAGSQAWVIGGQVGADQLGSEPHEHSMFNLLTGQGGRGSGPVVLMGEESALRAAIAALSGVDVSDVETAGGCEGIEVVDPLSARRGYLLITDGDAGYPTKNDAFQHELLVSWIDADGSDIERATPLHLDVDKIAGMLPADVITRAVEAVALWLATPPRTAAEDRMHPCTECDAHTPDDFPTAMNGWHDVACSLRPPATA